MLALGRERLRDLANTPQPEVRFPLPTSHTSPSVGCCFSRHSHPLPRDSEWSTPHSIPSPWNEACFLSLLLFLSPFLLASLRLGCSIRGLESSFSPPSPSPLYPITKCLQCHLRPMPVSRDLGHKSPCLSPLTPIPPTPYPLPCHPVGPFQGNIWQ